MYLASVIIKLTPQLSGSRTANVGAALNILILHLVRCTNEGFCSSTVANKGLSEPEGKKMAVGLKRFAARVGDGSGVPVLDSDNGEELIHVQKDVSIALANRPLESPGTLYITSKQVVWLSDLEREKGYAVDFLSVSLHAVSRDPEAFSSPCIYTQIDNGAEDESDSEESESESNETFDVSKVTEMRLVPDDPDQLDILFKKFCECAEMNPEPIELEEGGNNWIFSADQMDDDDANGVGDADWAFFQDPSNAIGQANGDHDLVHSVLGLQIDDERFEDADEMESDEEQQHHN